VASVSNGLECLAEVVALEADVLVIALDIPWGSGDGVIARLNGGLPVRRKPLILVIGDGAANTLSARTGVAQYNSFRKRIYWTELAWNPPSSYCAVQKIGNGRRKKV
jgi:hypothetical protein